MSREIKSDRSGFAGSPDSLEAVATRNTREAELMRWAGVLYGQTLKNAGLTPEDHDTFTRMVVSLQYLPDALRTGSVVTMPYKDAITIAGIIESMVKGIQVAMSSDTRA